MVEILEDKNQDLSIVKNHPLIFKIKKVALEFFNEWKLSLDDVYKNFVFEINEKSLIDDMVRSFSKALSSLFREEKQDNRRRYGFSVGFIQGYVSSNLSVHWSSKYVLPRTEGYKELMLLKTISSYLKVDLLTMHRLEKLYQYYLDNTIITKSIDYQNTTDLNVIDLQKFKQKSKQKKDYQQPTASFQKFTDDYFYELLTKRCNIILDELKFKTYPELDKFFTYEEINNLVNCYAKSVKDIDNIREV